MQSSRLLFAVASSRLLALLSPHLGVRALPTVASPRQAVSTRVGNQPFAAEVIQRLNVRHWTEEALAWREEFRNNPYRARTQFRTADSSQGRQVGRVPPALEPFEAQEGLGHGPPRRGQTSPGACRGLMPAFLTIISSKQSYTFENHNFLSLFSPFPPI